MIKKIIRITVLVLSISPCINSTANAQTKDETINKLTSLRDNFIDDIRALGYKPSLASPASVLDNPVSFGNYVDSTNTLHTTSDWQSAPEDLKNFFEQSAHYSDSALTGEAFLKELRIGGFSLTSWGIGGGHAHIKKHLIIMKS